VFKFNWLNVLYLRYFNQVLPWLFVLACFRSFTFLSSYLKTLTQTNYPIPQRQKPLMISSLSSNSLAFLLKSSLFFNKEFLIEHKHIKILRCACKGKMLILKRMVVCIVKEITQNFTMEIIMGGFLLYERLPCNHNFNGRYWILIKILVKYVCSKLKKNSWTLNRV